jgi:hypothetical protein
VPEIRRRQDWDASDLLDVAYLIVTPETNGGVESDVTLLDVYEHMPADLPAWAVWEDELICFVVGLIPFDGEKGFIHFAMTNTLGRTPCMQIVRAFLDSLPGVKVYALPTRPSMLPIARRLGFRHIGEQGGQVILERASQ